MQPDNIVDLAALNNAEWCNTVCTANGSPGNLNTQYWYSKGIVPAFYPNVVTIERSANIDDIHNSLGPLPGQYAIKDSFDDLALAKHNYRKLFEAQWIHAPRITSGPLPYTFIQNLDQLDNWKLAMGDATNAGSFNTEVFNNPSVRFIAITKQNRIIAGAIAYKSKNAIGLTNFFSHHENAADCRITSIRAAQEMDNNLPVLGYEHGQALSLAQKIGYRTVGPLSVWSKISHR